MLAIISIQLHNGTPEGAVQFAEEMREFGWKQHPQISDVFIADFPDNAPRGDVISTICCDVGISFGIAKAESWSGAVGLTRRASTPTAPLWD